MFTRLRNRFLLMNMVIITVIMFVAFASIYVITYQNANRDINMELGRVTEFYRVASENPGRGGDKKGGPNGGGQPPMFGGGSKGLSSPPERSVSFALKTDVEGGLLSVDSRFEMEDGFYDTAARKAIADTSGEGRVTLDGTRWAYRAEADLSGGYMVVYMDVTAQQNILTNLIYTFAVVALVMLAVIFATSRYFANRSIAPVRDAFEKQKRFIADASHELKTPLAVIQTNADVLLANETDTIGEQIKWLHRIKSETERMKTLTNDLLYLTQMDDSRAETLHVPFNVSEAVESVVLAMEAVIYERSLKLDYEIEPDLTVTGSAEQLKQVVMILLDNAIKYNRPEGTIGLTLRRHHGHIALTVTNSGAGIPAEQLDKVFDRFYRTDASRSRKQGGYGLGLAIAKSIVEQHRGKIQARSALGETTSFIVQLG